MTLMYSQYKRADIMKLELANGLLHRKKILTLKKMDANEKEM